MKTKYSNYLNLVEDHRADSNFNYNLFEKVLTVSARAKDLQQLISIETEDSRESNYHALNEFNRGRLTPVIKDRTIAASYPEFDDEDE